MSRFGHLSRFDPSGRTATMTLPIGKRVKNGSGRTKTVYTKLHMRHAGDSNKPWTNAVAKWNAKVGFTRRAVRGGTDVDELALQRDIELYPRHVITGWEDNFDTDGNPVPFDETACREFLSQLPEWLMTDVRLYAVTATNFLPDDEPGEEEIASTAGN